MRKGTLMLILFFVIKTGKAQHKLADTVHQLTKQDYLLKTKHQKIAAWSLLGGGFVLGTVGTVISVNEAGKGIGDIFRILFTFNQKPEGFNAGRFNTGLTLMFIGSAASSASIPFFISSGRKKKKAAMLSIRNQFFPQMKGMTFNEKAIPSFTLKIKL